MGAGSLGRKARRVAALGALLVLSWAAAAHGKGDGCRWDAASSAPASNRALTVTAYGVSTLVFDDGQDQLVIDGFFTRPRKIFGRLRSDEALVRTYLPYADRVRAMLVAHGHHDHAMDVPSLVRVAPEAVIVGTPAVEQIAAAAGAEARRICTPSAPWGRPLRYGAFRVSVFDTAHGDTFFLLRWLLDRPPARPARDGDRFWKFKDDENRSYLIEHGDLKLIVHPSASPAPPELVAGKSDVVFLGMGRVGAGSEKKARRYFAGFLGADPAKAPMTGSVVPVHWDRFMLPLSASLEPLSPPMDNAVEGLRRLCDYARGGPIEVWRLQGRASARILAGGVIEPVSGEAVACPPLDGDGIGAASGKGG